MSRPGSALRPIVSRFLHDGDADRDATAVVGEPVWGPTAFLRDLELRLGLAHVDASDAARAHVYSKRLQAGLHRNPFYTRSLEVDPHGTATTLLSWRDQLVEAGWCGQDLPNAGPRVEALIAAERVDLEPIPLGFADRLAHVEVELADAPNAPYESLELLEPAEVWPEGWRRVFDLLSGFNTKLVHRTRLPAAPPTSASDLAWTQAHLLTPRWNATRCQWRGDQSLVHIPGRTSWDLGETTAAFLRSLQSSDVLVVRLGDPAPLDAAFTLQGLPSQGRSASSPLRSPLQVLSLALALMFSPRDPYRALEMLTLPRGPFGTYASRILADAIGRAPGIGSRAWQGAKEKLTAPRDPADPLHVRAAAESTAKIEAWFEGPAFDRIAGAPRTEVLAVIDRVHGWALRRPHHEGGVNWAVLAHAAAELRHFVLAHPREALLPHEVEQLAARAIGSGMQHDLAIEAAGRIRHVSTPHAVLREHDVILVWHAGYDPHSVVRRNPWRAAEVRAFEAAGLHFADADRALAVESEAWRRLFGSARRVFAVATADTHLSDAQPALPLWDEIVARTAATPLDLKRVTFDAPSALADPALAIPLPPLSLPAAQRTISVDPASIQPALRRATTFYPTAMENLVACPMRWVLESLLDIRKSRLASIPEKTQLYGILGHRLAEELHENGSLDDPTRASATVESLLDRLIQHEGGPLLMPGMTAERAQVRQALLDAMRELSSTIASSGLRVAGVEVKTQAPWRGGSQDRMLGGRIDLLLVNASGEEAILDLKYGESRYREALTKGLALQIAVYAETRRRETGASKPVPAAYFALKKRRAIALDQTVFKTARVFRGEALDETWRKAEQTVHYLLDQLSAGTLHTSATADEKKLRFFAHHSIDTAKLPNAEAPYDAIAASACTYCSQGTICGRTFRALT